MPDLEILSPQPFQVIQRRGVLPLRHPGERADLSNGWAPVEIRARTSLAGELTLRLTVTPIGADPTGFSLTPTRSGGAGSFGTTVTDGLIRHTVSMPAGGWYALALAATAADGATATAHAGPFGIGELYLIGGQSHSNNWNDSLKTIADPAGRVTALDLHSGDWRIAHDPQPFNDSLAPMDAAAYWRKIALHMVLSQTSYSGGSIWPPAMNLLQPAIGVPIGMINVGMSGAPIQAWLPQNYAFERLRQAAAAAGHFRAVLWQQGEANVGLKTGTDEYLALFRAVRRTLAETIGSRRYDWIVAKSTHFPSTYDDPAAEAAIRDAVDIMAREDDDIVAGPDTDLLRGPHRAPSGTSGHLSGRGQDAAGALWFGTLLTHLNSSRRTASFL